MPRPEPAFTHPLLAGATTEAVREDCSKRALGVVMERVRRLELAAPLATAGKRGSKPTCPPVAAADVGSLERGELLGRIGACVARDGPFDVEWAMVHSAMLSLGLCLDCRQEPAERGARCGRARDVLDRIDRAIGDKQP